MEKFQYTTGVPAGYVCGTCGATHCKLWRRYQTFLDYQVLYCADCAGKNQEHDVSSMDETGTTISTPNTLRRSDSIGWLVPAVPTEDGETYWGYSSVPDAGVAWWKALPSRIS